MESKLSENMLEVIAQRFRVVGEPMRLRILQLLEPGEQSLNEIVSHLNSSQASVSKHLQALSQGGLISRRRDGLEVFYAIADPFAFRICEFVFRYNAKAIGKGS
jgi:DNA-binding transcriptional ArsR family regulator